MQGTMTTQFPKQIFLPNGSAFQALNIHSALSVIGLLHDLHQSCKNPIQHADVPYLENIELKFFHEDSGDFVSDESIEELLEVVQKWGTKSRVSGVRGNRALIMDPIRRDSDGGFSLLVQVGTGVWYNERRVTVGYPSNVDEWNVTLENLLDHLPEEWDLVSAESETHGALIESKDADETQDVDVPTGMTMIAHEMLDLALTLQHLEREEVLARLGTVRQNLEVLTQTVEDSE